MGKPKLILKSDANKSDVDTWLRTKANHISGTDAGCIMGVNPYKSAFSLYTEKIDQQNAIKLESNSPNDAAYWGTILEQTVADEFSKRMGYTLRKKGTLQDTQCPYRIANIDRDIIAQNAGLECKTASAYNEKLWKNGNIPKHYYYQCLHYMMVMWCDENGTIDKAVYNPRWYIACLIGGQKYVQREIKFSQEDAWELARKENEFFECLKNRIPPMISGTASDYKTLTEQVDTDDEEIELDTTVDEQISELMKANEAKKSVEERILKLKTSIGANLQNHNCGHTSRYIVKFSAPAMRETVACKDLKRKDPDLYKLLAERNWVKKSYGARVLRIKAVNENV